MPDTELFPARDVQKKSGYHHGDLRNSIIDAVSQLIDQRKSLDFQLKDVAALVGTSPPAIYRHFENKQALLVETAVAGYDLQKQYRTYALERSAPSPLAKLLSVGYAYIYFAQTCPGFFLLIKNLETDEILSSKRYRRQRLETVRLMRTLVKECIAEGLFIDIEQDLATASLQATAFGLAYLYVGDQLKYVANSLRDDKTLVARIYAINLGNLLSPKGKDQVAACSENPFV